MSRCYALRQLSAHIRLEFVEQVLNRFRPGLRTCFCGGSVKAAVSTQENKHWIGLDSFPSCIIHTARPKTLKILQLLIIGSQVQTGTENCYQMPVLEFNFVRIRSDPRLIFLSGNCWQGRTSS